MYKWDFNSSDYTGQNGLHKLTTNVMYLLGIVCFTTEAFVFLTILIIDWIKESLKHLHKVPRFILRKLVSPKKLYKYDRKLSVAAPADTEPEFPAEDSEDDMLDEEENPEVNNIEQIPEDIENEEVHKYEVCCCIS